MPEKKSPRPKKSASLIVRQLALPLDEHPKNPRVHPEPGDEEWELLRASLADAYFDPMVWNSRNGMLVSGHLRQKVMLAEGFTHADCVVVDWPEEKHIARMIAANRGAGEDDEVALKLLLEESGIDLKLTGLTKAWTAEVLAKFNPVASSEQGRLDQRKTATCPNCQHVFAP